VKNILTVPGNGFGGPGHFRIAFCVPYEVIERSHIEGEITNVLKDNLLEISKKGRQ